MSSQIDPIVAGTVAALRDQLKDNLYSCCLYGSWVRGNAIAGVSDFNLLIVLNETNPAAHAAIATVISKEPRLDPFILGRRGFERSARAFASKFASIRRNYRVLHGADPLSELRVDPALARFLCEQALRNLRLRMVQAYVTRARNKGYERFLALCVTPLFVGVSEVLRINGVTLPADIPGRISLIQTEFRIDGQVLRDLFAFKASPAKLSDDEQTRWHQRLFPVVDAVMAHIETKWTQQI
jgi:hypothetical protein